MKKPEIVCLCGSTKFKEIFEAIQRRMTLQGKIVLSVGLFGHREKKFPNPETKAMLDELHKRRIDLADSVFVINKGGYIGDSTRSEINYTLRLGKPVEFMEDATLKAVNP